jgi:hypothetical protein
MVSKDLPGIRPSMIQPQHVFPKVLYQFRNNWLKLLIKLYIRLTATYVYESLLFDAAIQCFSTGVPRRTSVSKIFKVRRKISNCQRKYAKQISFHQYRVLFMYFNHIFESNLNT